MKLRSGESGGRLPLSWDFDSTVLFFEDERVGVWVVFSHHSLSNRLSLRFFFFDLVGPLALALVLFLLESSCFCCGSF